MDSDLPFITEFALMCSNLKSINLESNRFHCILEKYREAVYICLKQMLDKEILVDIQRNCLATMDGKPFFDQLSSQQTEYLI